MKLFGIGATPATARSAEGLTEADRRAIAADLQPLDEVEKGLGEAVTRHVLGGEEASAFLRIEALLAGGRNGSPPDIVSALQPWGAYTENKTENKRRLAARARVIMGLEGFDPGVMRRYGQLFAYHYATGSYRWNFPGSDASPLWLRTLVAMVTNHLDRDQNPKGAGFLSVPRIAAMLEGAGIAFLRPLVDCAFTDGEERRYSSSGSGSYLRMDGFAEALAARPDEALEAIRALAASGRLTMLNLLARTQLINADPRFFDFAFASAGDGSRVVRDGAIATLAGADAARIRQKANEALASRQAADRLAAVRMLLARFGAEALPILDAHEASGEKAKAVLQAIATARGTATLASESDDGVADGAEGFVAFDGALVPAPPPSEPEPPLPADLEAALREVFEAVNAAARVDYDRTPPGKNWNERPAKPFAQPIDPRVARHVVAAMRGESLSDADRKWVRRTVAGHLDHWMTTARRAHWSGLLAVMGRNDVGTVAIARLLFLDEGRNRAWTRVVQDVLGLHSYTSDAAEKELKRRLEAGADFRAVIEAAEAAERPFRAEYAECESGYANFPTHPKAPRNDSVWPVLSANMDVLDAGFGTVTSRARGNAADVALFALRFFPRLPRRFFPAVVDRASQGTLRQRNFARWLLRDIADLTPVIAPMLEAGPEATRIAGARWLGERRDPAAIAPLRAALLKEKSVGASAAILAALAACGDDVSDQFSEEKLLADAEAGLAKTKADFSVLFDADNLPALRWADGRPVPPKLVRWWFVRAHKLKNPGGDPLLHMALERLDRSDAERLGREVLSAFIAYDTRRPSSEEANAYAGQHAKSRADGYKRWRQDYTEDLAFAELRREKLAEYLGSALDHRGLLALARFAPAAESTALVKRFLRDHGKRPNQCRALVDALMANPTPSVLQLVLAASQRHKQPGLRKYAGEVAARYAEDRGWTPAELADRTIPTAGLDETGILELPIGERTFRARLETAKNKKGGQDLRLVLENPDGKPVASLPSPSDPDEASEAKDAKAALSAAKKELKQTAELQTKRLYEAMCSGRIWSREDFEGFILGHPVMVHLVRRLVLSGHDADGAPIASFRALEDGSFTDAEDGRVEVAAFSGIAIAHRAGLGEAASEAWRTHLSDYEVAPLFEQFERPTLEGAKPEATRIEDRRGWMIDNLALRSAAEGLGYGRGSVEDGAGFYTYEKTFPDSELVAVIEFSGSYIGETERVAKFLTALTFEPAGGERAGRWFGSDNGVKLADVPPVLLSEAWNDYHQIAAKGTGYDPAHERKGGW
ncbi:DUF4132 domain-containing protein [Antarcticirhabdus aurantiaca]|uniref:DUF4132 domain-containing protein n=1 Tax=Antarcticirhabdus aurantiaca TaxID=2606717 RepID=A0ACD4NUF2_9HYPH|nr:DUF4132 domain-containing protein [Antarcticirhabdus aurantiaca]WAJ30350.1 DUF4132 domain-containing protein [Jeongeuplla avenae]